MPRHWFIKTKNGKTGPVTSKMLVQLVHEGKLATNAGVSPDGESWLKVKKVLGLSFPESKPNRWYVQTKHGNAGPFTLPKLQKLVRAGRIRANYAVSRDCSEWIQAQHVRGLQFPDLVGENRQRVAAPKSPPDPAPAVHPSSEPTVADEVQSAGCDVQQGRKQPVDEGEQPPLEPSDTDRWAELREAEFIRRFGPVAEIPPDGDQSDHAIRVSVHPPSSQRPFTTLVTSGMSDLAMPVSSGPCSPRAELILYVGQMHATYIDLLRFLAEIPQREKTWLAYGSTMGNGNPVTSIFPGSVLDHYVFMIPNVESDFKIRESVRIGDHPLQLLSVVPITAAERDFITRHGMQSLCALFDQNNHSLLIDPSRRCYATVANSLVG